MFDTVLKCKHDLHLKKKRRFSYQPREKSRNNRYNSGKQAPVRPGQRSHVQNVIRYAIPKRKSTPWPLGLLEYPSIVLEGEGETQGQISIYFKPIPYSTISGMLP